MRSRHGVNAKVVVCVLAVGVVVALCCSGSGMNPPGRKRLYQATYMRRHLRQPTPVTNGFLQISLELPAKFDFGGSKPLPGPIQAKVKITNIFRDPIGLQCDSSPRAILYLRFESLLQYNTPWILERELFYDLGDQLLDGAAELGMCVLEPGEVVEAQVNIAPILYPPMMNFGTFRVRVELRSPPWDGLVPSIDGIREAWGNISIVSEESTIQIIGYGDQ